MEDWRVCGCAPRTFALRCPETWILMRIGWFIWGSKFCMTNQSPACTSLHGNRHSASTWCTKHVKNYAMPHQTSSCQTLSRSGLLNGDYRSIKPPTSITTHLSPLLARVTRCLCWGRSFQRLSVHQLTRKSFANTVLTRWTARPIAPFFVAGMRYPIR